MRAPPLAALVAALCLGMTALPSRDAAADPPDLIPLSIEVSGTGEIRLIVSEGSGRPCESSDNRILYQGHVSSGHAVDVRTVAGWVCIDHTFGSFRESQWAGAALWGVGDRGASPSKDAVLRIPISTDRP